MPPKKKVEKGRNMEAKVAALETEIASLKVTMSENQEKLMALLIKSLEKKNTEGGGDSNGNGKEGETIPEDKEKENGGTPCNTFDSGMKKLQGETLEEFRQSVKKVELPMFDGDDPAGWISYAEVYFRVQNTNPEVRVNLAQLCMEGSTIHFFNSLLNEEEELTWERLKTELLDRYGGLGEGDVFEQLSSLKQTGGVDEYI